MYTKTPTPPSRLQVRRAQWLGPSNVDWLFGLTGALDVPLIDIIDCCLYPAFSLGYAPPARDDDTPLSLASSYEGGRCPGSWSSSGTFGDTGGVVYPETAYDTGRGSGTTAPSV